jgi:hypothetical protein
LIQDFRDKIRATGAEDVVFYYAGHGFQLDGRNHLVPIDARPTRREQIGYETIQLNKLIKQINADPRKQRTIVFLDACRDNPLPESVRGEDYENGLADVQMGKDGDNVMVIFSTRPGEVSQDGKGSNSPFAESLLRHIATPNETVVDMMAAVSNEVYEATLTRQTPRVSGILRSKFYFNRVSSAIVTADPMEEENAGQQTADGGEGPSKPPKIPSVTLSEIDSEPTGPASDVAPPSDQIANNGTEQQISDAPGGDPTSSPGDTPPPSDQVASSEAGPVVEIAPVTAPASLPPSDARLAPSPAKPEVPVEGVTVEASNQGEQPPVIEPESVEQPLPEGTVMAGLDPNETAQESAASPSLSLDPARDRGIAVIRPSPAAASGGLPVSEKPVMIAQRPADVPALRPSGEKLLDDEGATAAADEKPSFADPNNESAIGKQSTPPEEKVTILTPSTETVEPSPSEPEAEEQPDIAQKVQIGLSQVGCFDGQADGQWGPDSETALAKYVKEKGVGDPTAGPTEEVLASLEAETEQVCSSEPEETEAPAQTKKPDSIKKAPDIRKPRKAKRPPPPVVKKPAIRKPPPVVKKPPPVVRRPPPKRPPPKVATQQRKPQKPPAPPAKTSPKIPKIGGFAF